MAAKTIRELTADTSPAQTRLLVTQDPSSGEPTKSTGAQFLAAAGLNPAAANGIILERPAASSQNAYPWRMIVNQNNFDDNSGIGGENYYNEVTAIGWNLSGTVGVPATESTPSFWDSWESKYNAGGVDYAFERHIEMVDSNGDPHRVFSLLLPHDGGTESSGFIAIDSFRFFEFDADTPVIQLDIKNRAAYFGDASDAFILAFHKNNTAPIQQRNAADNAFLSLPYFNASDKLQVLGQIAGSADSPGAGASGHEFVFTGAAGAGSTLVSVALGTAQTDVTLNALAILASTNWDLIALIQNNNNAAQYSSAVQSLQTAASNGMAYLRTGYTGGQQWSMGMRDTQNFVLSAASNLTSAQIFSVDKTNQNVSFNQPPKVPSYAMSGLPSASTFGAGSMIYVTDETGGATLAFADGTVWRRVSDRAEVSA